MYKLQFDGGSRGNPGIGGCGAVIFQNNIEIWNEKYYLGDNITNNQAEYSGLICGLEYIQNLDIKKLEIEGDSNLVIKQISGVWKVKNTILQNLYDQVTKYIDIINKKNKNPIIEFKHIKREYNSKADNYANFAMDNKTNINTSFYKKIIKLIN